jgi:hypothetical protein
MRPAIVNTSGDIYLNPRIKYLDAYHKRSHREDDCQRDFVLQGHVQAEKHRQDDGEEENVRADIEDGLCDQIPKIRGTFRLRRGNHPIVRKGSTVEEENELRGDPATECVDGADFHEYLLAQVRSRKVDAVELVYCINRSHTSENSHAGRIINAGWEEDSSART